MRRILAVILLLTAPSCPLMANVAGDEKFAGKLTDYRVTDNHTVVVQVDAVRIFSLDAKAQLFKLKDEIVIYPSVAEVTMHYDTPAHSPNGTDRSYLEFSFTSFTFQSGEDYELRFSGHYKNSAASPDIKFSSALLRFSTTSDLAVLKNPGANTVKLFGRVALTGPAGGTNVTDEITGTSFVLQPAGLPGDFDATGQVNVLGAPISIDPRHLKVSGIQDVFSNAPAVRPTKPIGQPVAPKNKDAAVYYLNFLHQAGVGLKPTWIANVKVAPVFGVLPGGYLLTPELNVDIGQGQVGTTKTNDIINPKIGVTRLVRTRAGILENLQYTAAFSYETNRKFDKRNALFDGDLRFYLKNLQNTRAERTQDAFFKERLVKPNILPQDVPEAFFGYSIKLFLGTESGGALTSNQVQSSDETSEVTVPKYAIRRLRPSVSATFEFARVTTALSFTPRFLFSAENVTREIDTIQPDGTTTKTVILSTVSGWRGYGEISVSYSIDVLGHYAFNTVYKRGSQPPNFDRVNLFQSGILVRF